MWWRFDQVPGFTKHFGIRKNLKIVKINGHNQKVYEDKKNE